MVVSSPSRLPVTVVTGFLGAGKTTLLRHLLLHSGQRLAVIVNEFGDVGIDADILSHCGFCPEEELEGRLVELTNGCLCCTVQDDFLPTMERLLERADQLDGLVVETSGLALPEPLVAAFQWPAVRTRTRVHAVVTVVDGEALAAGHVVGDGAAVERQRQVDPSLEHLSSLEELFAEQLELADLVAVSRADTVAPASLTMVMAGLSGKVRPGTPVVPMARGVLPIELLLGGDGDIPPDDAVAGATDAVSLHDHDHVHVAMESLLIRRWGSLSRQTVETALRELLQCHPVLRLKGRLQEPGKRLALQLQAVGPRLEGWYEGVANPDPQCPALELVALVPAAHLGALRAATEALWSSAGVSERPSQVLPGSGGTPIP
ncbi:MAG: GTP-binding protein [Cyanobacteriota bacterium]|nr:GTP-binding protein [Cyanobacteriota bacterium]